MCLYGSYPVSSRQAKITINDNDWFIEKTADAVEPKHPPLPDADDEEVNAMGSPGVFVVQLKPSNENWWGASLTIDLSHTATGTRFSDAEGLDDDASCDDYPAPDGNDIADKDGFCKDEGDPHSGDPGGIVNGSKAFIIKAGTISRVFSLIPWYDNWTTDPDENVHASLTAGSGTQVDPNHDEADMTIAEPGVRPLPCTCVCAGGSGCGAASFGVNVPNGNLGIQNSGTPLT